MGPKGRNWSQSLTSFLLDWQAPFAPSISLLFTHAVRPGLVYIAGPTALVSEQREDTPVLVLEGDAAYFSMASEKPSFG
jgi:hypothetical protein